MGYIYLIEWETLWEKEKLLIKSNFSFSHNVFKSCLLLLRQNEYLCSKGFKTMGKKHSAKNLWEMEKMLITSIILHLPQCFHPFKAKIHYLILM